jgi:hypothetical protein
LPIPPPLSLGRVARLAMKELRETLRDRRTIITLVLMPLLVYPLLSLAFKQFLLSSFRADSCGIRLRCRRRREQRDVAAHAGRQATSERESAAASRPLSGGPLLGGGSGGQPALFDNDIFPLGTM